MKNLSIDKKNVSRKELSDVFKDSMGEMLDLSHTQIARIKKRLRSEISGWKNDTGTLHKTLQDWNDLVEGVVEESDWPWEGATNFHIDLTLIYMKVYHSIERRSILGPEQIWYAETSPEFDDLQDFTADVDEMINYKARSEWNIEEMLSEAFWAANRDSLSWLMVPYVIDTERAKDSVFIENEEQLDEFLSEFEGEDGIGIDEQELLEIRELVQSEASTETPIEIPFEYDKEIYRGPKAYLVERVDFVSFPATCRSLSREYCRGYGHRFTIRRGEIKRKGREKEWDPEAVKSFLAKTSSGSAPTAYDIARESIVGLSRSAKSDDYEFFYLVLWHSLSKQGDEEKLVFVYSEEHDELMVYKSYIYRVDIYAPFRIERKVNQMDGRSIPGQLEVLNEGIDLSFNMRFHAREITNVPAFKAKSSFKKEYDAAADEYKFKPGCIFWMSDPTLFEQFRIAPVDMGESMREEQNLFRIASLVLGVDAFLFSGKAQPEDPEAPGNKTALLVDQGNLRMEDPLAELRVGVEKVGEICLSHLYQFGEPLIPYNVKNGKKTVTKFMNKRVLRNGIKMKMRGISVVVNPEEEFQKWMMRYRALTAEPAVANSPERRIEIMRQALQHGRIPGRDKILPSVEEIRQQEIDTTESAMRQLMAKNQMAAQMQAAQGRQRQMQGVQEYVKRKSLSARMAQQMATAIAQEQSNGTA